MNRRRSTAGRPRAAALIGLALTLAGCGHEEGGETKPSRGPLSPGVVARVGDTEIPASLVRAVARRQGIAPSEALDRLVGDAVLAQTHDASEAEQHAVRVKLRGARARWLATRIRERAKADGPLTDPEIRELSKLRWREADMPERWRVAHALVMRPRTKDKARIANARSAADRLAEAIGRPGTVDEFEKRAKELSARVKGASIEVRVERLPAIAADGRVAEGPPGEFDRDFARGASALARVGDVSPIVESSFGWHVIYLMERLPADPMPWAERRALFSPAMVDYRSDKRFRALKARLREARTIEVSSAAGNLMQTATAQVTSR